MTDTETEREIVQRHIQQGLGHVARQEALVIKMREAGRPMVVAEETLQILTYLQKEHEAHLERRTLREQRDALYRDRLADESH